MTDEKNLEAEESEEEYDTIVLTDENGKETEFEFLDLIEYEDKEYIVLLPMEGSADDDQVYIFETEDAGDDMVNYKSVSSSKVLNAVFEIFKEKFKDEFNFID